MRNLVTCIQHLEQYTRTQQLPELYLRYYEKECIWNHLISSTGNKGYTRRKTHGGTRLLSDAKQGLIDSGLHLSINAPVLTTSHGNKGQITCQLGIMLVYYCKQIYANPHVYINRSRDLCWAEEFHRLAPYLALDAVQSFQKPQSTRLSNMSIAL